MVLNQSPEDPAFQVYINAWLIFSPINALVGKSDLF